MVPIPLPELLRREWGVPPRPVEEAIFGTAEAEPVAEMVARSVRNQLGVAVDGGLFCHSSSGSVFGLLLADGRTIVLKAYQPHWEPSFLRGVQRAQRAVFAAGYPCPEPLTGPAPIGHGWATIESWLPDPGQSGPFGPRQLEQSSRGLMALMRAAATVDPDGLDQHPFRIAPGHLYPTPHNPIFDLAATGDGAEWIDTVARRAWALRESGTLPRVVAHLDWSANNVRLGRGGVTAVYDWDSLSLAPVVVAAGQAAATWRSSGESGDPTAPAAAEVEQFIAAFGAARGEPLSPTELSAAYGAAVWVMAYSARCEHALEARTTWKRRRARDWLRTQAELLL